MKEEFKKLLEHAIENIVALTVDEQPYHKFMDVRDVNEAFLSKFNDFIQDQQTESRSTSQVYKMYFERMHPETLTEVFLIGLLLGRVEGEYTAKSKFYAKAHEYTTPEELFKDALDTLGDTENDIN